MAAYWKLYKFPILLVLSCTLLYVGFAYDLVRTDFIKLIMLYGALFYLSYSLIRIGKNNFRLLLLAGILFRLSFLWAIPNLSQDFYRFIWDGRLILHGINPYLYLPDQLIETTTFNIPGKQELYQGMGWLSAKHFSNYPPLSQGYFFISNLIGGKGILGPVIFMRLMVILADIGILYFGKKILTHFKLPGHRVFWYFLNPLTIIELTGNLHFESIMLFFFIWSVYLLLKGKWWQSALVMGASVSVKLIPFLLLPLLFKYLGWKKSIAYYGVVVIVNLLLFLPFLSPSLINNYSNTLGLWFTNFEFNASAFNLVKELGYVFTGKNTIKTIGKFSPLIISFIVILFTFFRKNQLARPLLVSMLLVLSIYYFLATTVHPWYLSFLVLLTMFTHFKYSLLWSATVMLSYFTYSNPEFKESPFLLFIQYLPVYVLLFYEIINSKRLKIKYS